jgi:large subunit ribosomal protein L1
MAGKRLRNARESLDVQRSYSLMEALELSRTLGKERFNASVDVALRTGLDPRKADQNIRGLLQLPSGLGKVERVAVFARGDLVQKALDAGADVAGGEDLIEKVKEGFLDFDRCIATPDMMVLVGQLGRVLGPKGLMPNPKLGTVTADVERAVTVAKKGQMEYRLDKTAIIHGSVGRIAFSVEDLYANVKALLSTVWKARPASAKGELFRGFAFSSTMGPGIMVDLGDVKRIAQEG